MQPPRGSSFAGVPPGLAFSCLAARDSSPRRSARAPALNPESEEGPPETEASVADFGCIENRRDLEALAQVLLSKKVVAIDTEADSFYHYFDKVCLVQIGTKDRTFLVDPLAMGGSTELAPLPPSTSVGWVRRATYRTSQWSWPTRSWTPPLSWTASGPREHIATPVRSPTSRLIPVAARVGVGLTGVLTRICHRLRSKPKSAGQSGRRLRRLSSGQGSCSVERSPPSLR